MMITNYDVFADIAGELINARDKFPKPTHMMNALTEEVGELAQALLHLNFEPKKGKRHEDVYSEAIQVAVCAIRVATEGDSTLPAYHPESGYRGVAWDGYKSLADCDERNPSEGNNELPPPRIETDDGK